MYLHFSLEKIQHITGDNLTIEVIPSGLTNSIYKINNNKNTWAFRINHQNSEELGIDRVREKNLLDQFSLQPWSPTVIHNSHGLLLTQWVEGQALNISTQSDLNNLIDLVKNIQQQVINTESSLKPINVIDQIKLLKSTLRNLSSNFSDAIDRACAMYQFPTKLVLCHHDWHPGNIVENNNNLVILDWEYSALGDPYIDFASIILGFDLETIQREYLISEFNLNEALLKLAICLTEAMSILWFEVRFPEDNHKKQIDDWMSKWLKFVQ